MLNKNIELVLAHIDELALEPYEQARGWDHMGAVIVDAGLQAGLTYRTTVLPRARNIVAHWPDATTTSTFVQRLDQEELAEILDWKPDGKKLQTIRDLAKFLAEEGIEEPNSLQHALNDDSFRKRLRRISGIGPKTVDYLGILTGSNSHVAVDSQLRAFVKDAGVVVSSYREVQEIIVAAAEARGWSPGALDAAIWSYQSANSGQ